uniref:3'-5' exonuclease n=1 Tax=uncultured Selenomonas sp. TaxID=159275 RepID=UPI0025FD01E6
MRTFHSFCYDVIKSEAKRHSDLFTDFVIFDESDCRTLIRDLMGEELDVPAATLARLLAFTKEKLAVWDILTGDPAADAKAVVARIYREAKDDLAAICVDDHYQRLPRLVEGWQVWGASFLRRYDMRLQEAHGLDFTDLIVRAKRLLREREIAQRWAARFQYINIDEAQDTSTLEYGILERIFGKSKILLAGDLFQTIYGWRGSHPEVVVRRFEETHHPEKIVLSENYRSTRTLLKASFGALERLFPKRVAKVYPEGFAAESTEEGAPVEVKGAADFAEEAQWIYYRILELPVTDYSRIAILVRSNRYAKELSAQFRAIGQHVGGEALPFLLIDDTRFFQRQEVKDALAFLRLAVNRHDVASLMRVLGRYVRGVGPAAIRTISSQEYRRAGVRMTDYLDPAAREAGDPF